MPMNTKPDFPQCNCFLVDYTDKQGQCRNQVFSCLSLAGNIMQDARDIQHHLVEQGYTVTLITFVPGAWTTQQLEEIADRKRPAVPGTTPIYADFEAIRRSCMNPPETQQTQKSFARWLVSKYCASTWDGCRYSMNAYGKNMSLQENIQALAFDVLRDFGFPCTSTDKKEILSYLKRVHASPEVLNTARKAFDLYTKEVLQ